jgi:hypothetical protein
MTLAPPPQSTILPGLGSLWLFCFPNWSKKWARRRQH